MVGLVSSRGALLQYISRLGRPSTRDMWGLGKMPQMSVSMGVGMIYKKEFVFS